MRALSASRMIGGTIVVAAVLAPGVHAQTSAEAVRLTILTFSAPVQLPGMTLPAGKYRFEMADLNTTGHTVRVSKEDGTNVGLFKTISTTNPTRDLRDTDVLIMWAERAAGQPQALREWYYPQRSTGEEFVYPRAEARAIAVANRASVLTEENGKIVRIEGSEGAATETAASTTAAETRIAQNTAPASVGTSGQSSQTPAPASAPERRTLPRTASQLSLVELLSGLSIAAALGVRHLRVRNAARS